MKLIDKYFPGLEPGQNEQMERFAKEILKWNSRLNLVSRRDMAHIEEKHILHSLSIAAFYPFTDSCRIMDLGTGGGLPGIPLAICHPWARFTLVDSIAKKVNAVREITDSIGLSNVEIRHGRAEKMDGRFHMIVARAVAPLNRIVEWTKDMIISPSNEFPHCGIICLKGGDLEQELGTFPSVKIHSISEQFTEPFFESKKLIYLPKT